MHLCEPNNGQYFHLTEISQMISMTDQLISFYIKRTLVANRFKEIAQYLQPVE